MKPVEPIHLVDRFPPLHTALLTLLHNLSGADWHRPTAARLWMVKDIAAHLLDGDVRRLALRDAYQPPQPAPAIESYRELVDMLNRMNAAWVEAARRISPAVLIDLLALTGPQVHAYFASLDPFAPAPFPVAWAGDETSTNWFDLAREYTEKWHHQQQIRDAVGAPGLTGRTWLHPVLDTFMRGLPHRYRDVEAAEGACVTVYLTGEAGGIWTLCRKAGGWHLYAGQVSDPAARVRLNQDTAWRLFTKGLTSEDARARVRLEGDSALGTPMLEMIAIMG